MTFEEIYKTYWDKIFRLCLGYSNNHDAAKDLAQETFIKVWQALPDFRNECSVSTWIFRIASNHCLRHIERQKTRKTSALNFSIPEELPTENSEEVNRLYAAIAKLKEADRILISLALEEIKQAEIAEILGLTEANVRVRIHRIKKKLLNLMNNGRV